MKYIDDILNQITMYRLVLYSLVILTIVSLFYALLGMLYYSVFQFLVSLVIITVVSLITNFLVSRIVKAKANPESFAITALILFLIVAPPSNIQDGIVIAVIAAIAMVSKYLFSIHKKHLFNPAALALVIAGMYGATQAVWWVGSAPLLPIVALLGFMIVRKIRRFRMVLAFLAAALVSITAFGIYNQVPLETLYPQVLLSWPVIFFATIMLTEPLTMPPTKQKQIIYGVITGLLFGSQYHIGPFFSTPELALVIGNVYSYFVSPRRKFTLTLQNKIPLSQDTYEYVFEPDYPMKFSAGQYLEWTLPHHNSDSRGVRRYFTIASSPDEKEIRLGVKIQQNGSSSFKSALRDMKAGDTLLVGQLAGDFTAVDHPAEKMVFIAGGIGVTPFRSIIKQMIDNGVKKDIVLFYVCSHHSEFVYQDIFEMAKNYGVNVQYVITHAENAPSGWTGKVGYINEEMIQNEVSDYAHRTYFISGPNSMVNSYKKVLHKLGIKNDKIITDYFPGF